MKKNKTFILMLILTLTAFLLISCDLPRKDADTGPAKTEEPVTQDPVSDDEDEVGAEEEQEQEEEEAEEPEAPPEPLEKYRDLLKINPYIAGWLKIDDSRIDDPVVYTPGSQNYFLHRAIDGTYEQKGTLFIAINWQYDYNNTIIYGHNMKDGTAFGSLAKFADESYGMSHNIIHFDTLYEEREYQLYGCFYSQIDDEDLETDEARAEDDQAVENGELDLAGDFGDLEDYDLYRQEKDEDNGRFRYYYYTDLSDKADFDYFAENVKERAVYDTGVEAEWGDEFVTLSTCSYHVRNGRFVVVGVRKNKTN